MLSRVKTANIDVVQQGYTTHLDVFGVGFWTTEITVMQP